MARHFPWLVVNVLQRQRLRFGIRFDGKNRREHGKIKARINKHGEERSSDLTGGRSLHTEYYWKTRKGNNRVKNRVRCTIGSLTWR